jgi:hypothetical protein
MGLWDRLGSRRPESDPSTSGVTVVDPVYSTKALRKFLTAVTAKESPVILDLGPVVGGNVSFFGENLGCKIFVEDIFADLDRHVREGTTDALPDFLTKRFPQRDGTVDGVLCWDIMDYLDRPSAQALADQLTRLLRPEGALLAFFATTQVRDLRYTKYFIVDDLNLRYRPYSAARGRQAVLPNRDIIRLFTTLRVAESFLLQNNIREILFRKPAYAL